MTYLCSLCFLHRNSTSSAMKWLWRPSAPSDWLWAEILVSELLLTLPVTRNATLRHTKCKSAFCWPKPHLWARVFESVCDWFSLNNRGHACVVAYLSVCIYVCACDNTHTTCTEEKKSNKHTHCWFSCVCSLQWDWRLYMLVQRKKKKMIRWGNIRCLKKATFSFSLSPLLGCDVTIVQYFPFRYILRLECCLPLKAGCTLEDSFGGTFTFNWGFGLHPLSTQSIWTK